MKPTGPLSGIRVLDLSRVLAGPIATQMLGDFGADVIKVEAPGKGDDSRGYGPHFGKDTEGNPTRESGFYLSSNRNKRSITCDFATEEGRGRILELARGCDVLVENFRPGSLARRGLGYEHIRAINPRAIYASLTGFGQDSPYAARPGYDAIFQAQGGWMSVTGEPAGAWSKAGPSLVDVFSGTIATLAGARVSTSISRSTIARSPRCRT
jgi:crotonobetainyl-CoA:carnitine CoA-transferase CaiB-like acyl-CoA transferase